MRRKPTKTVVAPIFPVSNLGQASDFYKSLGFEVSPYDNSYAVVVEGGTEIVHLEVSDRSPAVAYLNVPDVDARHTLWSSVGARLTPIADKEWDMREFELTDTSGNTLRVGSNV